MLGFSTQHKKNDEPTPDEHIPLVRLDDSSWTHGFSVGEGDKLQRMETIARSKDAMLDDMESAVDRLGFIASTIRSEVIEHNDMLDTLDQDIDEADERMGSTMKKITKLLGTSDKGRLCCIFWLIVINLRD
eukprot:jgi/Bigna1/91688/estExt_fgenesh1_pg.C_1130034